MSFLWFNLIKADYWPAQKSPYDCKPRYDNSCFSSLQTKSSAQTYLAIKKGWKWEKQGLWTTGASCINIAKLS